MYTTQSKKQDKNKINILRQNNMYNKTVYLPTILCSVRFTSKIFFLISLIVQQSKFGRTRARIGKEEEEDESSSTTNQPRSSNTNSTVRSTSDDILLLCQHSDNHRTPTYQLRGNDQAALGCHTRGEEKKEEEKEEEEEQHVSFTFFSIFFPSIKT